MIMRGRPALIMLSIIVAAGAMLLWVRIFDVSLVQLRGAMSSVAWPVVPLLFALLAAHVALASWRWSLIEVGLGGPRPHFGYAFATGAVGTGLATVLPAPAVAIASRGIANRLSGTSGLRGTLSGAIDQSCDLAAVLLLTLPAAAAFVERDVAAYIWGAGAMILLGLVIVLLLPPVLRSFLPHLRFLDAAAASRLASRPLLLSLYVISLLRMANLTLMTLAIHGSASDTMAGAIIVGVPLLTLAIWTAMLPGGFGVSEWSFSVLFSHFGIGNNAIVHFVMANRIVWTALSLTLMLLVLGASLLALAHRRRAPSL